MKVTKKVQTFGLALGLVLLLGQGAAATIYNWQTGQPIPGTEGITPQPGVNLSFWNTSSHNLKYGDFRSTDLHGSNFYYSWLDYAHFGGANLTSADLYQATLTDADLTDAVVRGADFGRATSRGFTKEQLYSTASWKAKDLTDMGLSWNDLSGWNLAGQNLTLADLWRATLTGADLTGADLTNAYLYQATLTGADLSGADLSSANLSYATLTGANLTSANLTRATLTGADLTLADLRKAKGALLTAAITRNTILPDGTVAGLNLLAGDTLIIRNCDLAVTVQSAMTLAQGSEMEFLLDNVWGSAVTAATGVVPDLGGILYLGFADGIDPGTLVGQTFDIFNWSGPLDAGNRFDDVRSEWPLWDLGALYTTGEVTLLPEPATLSLLALGGLALLRRRRR
jgi:uncharacterized protein YjbI with pentapeptide repeats